MIPLRLCHSRWQTKTTRVTLMMCLVLTLLASNGCRKSGPAQNLSSSVLDPNVFNRAFVDYGLESNRFDLGDFNDNQKIWDLLQSLINTHYRGILASRRLAKIFDDPSAWLRGTEKSEAVLWEVCREPAFTFTPEKCSVVFNVIRMTGGVDEWTVVFRKVPEDETIEIFRVEITTKKPPGTFSWALVG